MHVTQHRVFSYVDDRGGDCDGGYGADDGGETEKR